MRQQAEPAEARLAFEPRGQVRGDGDSFQGRGEGELAWVEYERLASGDIHGAGEVVLPLRGVDVCVALVVEHPEHSVEAHVDTGGLDEFGLERVDTEPPVLDGGGDVAVREDHGIDRIRW